MKHMLILMSIISISIAAQTQGVSNIDDQGIQEILDAHNIYREGLSNLTWSFELATHAQDWANKLASQGGALNHCPPYSNYGEGENLWGTDTCGALSLTQMVDSWGNERLNYIHTPIDNQTIGSAVSKTGIFKDVSNYTQMIWGDTREVGCGLACQDGAEVLVCRYKPAGNMIGEYAGSGRPGLPL